MTTIRVPINIELDNQFFEDVLVTAFEGGSNYWVDCIEIGHPGGIEAKRYSHLHMGCTSGGQWWIGRFPTQWRGSKFVE